MRKRGPASRGATESTNVLVVGVSRVDGVKTCGRADADRLPTAVDIRDATFRVGDQIGQKHKRVNPTG
jgi:hypothetical protein